VDSQLHSTSHRQLSSPGESSSDPHFQLLKRKLDTDHRYTMALKSFGLVIGILLLLGLAGVHSQGVFDRLSHAFGSSEFAEHSNKADEAAKAAKEENIRAGQAQYGHYTDNSGKSAAELAREAAEAGLGAAEKLYEDAKDKIKGTASKAYEVGKEKLDTVRIVDFILFPPCPRFLV
jgi:hypothetical protein